MVKRDPHDPYKCECGQALVYCRYCEHPTGKCPVHDADWIAGHARLEGFSPAKTLSSTERR